MNRLLFATATLGALAAVLALAPLTAAASTGLTSANLLGVSCPTATDCTAVGWSNNGTGGPALPLAMRWRKSTGWRLQPIPSPTGAISSFLEAVSCPTARDCTAVGDFYGTSNLIVPLVERWSGMSWSVQSTPAPTGLTAGNLEGVSCPTAIDCTAVGWYSSNGGPALPLAERWSGKVWRLQSLPSATGALTNVLFAVSCPTARHCTAAGRSHYSSLIGDLPLAEQWNGVSWTIQPTPTPTGETLSVLTGVSCSAVTACTAVGWYSTGGTTELPLVERWNGFTWNIQPTLSPPATGNILIAVSCPTSADCTAVGQSENGGPVQTLAEQWDGTDWHIQVTPNANAPARDLLDSVSCRTAADCTAVGWSAIGSFGLTLAERWNGTAWHIQTTPSISS